MEVFLLALFVLGVATGFIFRAFRPPQPRPKFRQKDGLDTVDEMFLHGEVNNDDFYRM